MRQGIPAVIAMQFEISDPAALVFSQSFYQAIADGLPVDVATVEARRAMFAEGNEVEWATPVLYLRSPDGRVFRRAGSPDAERKAREDAERKAREDAERKAREDAERKAREDAERRVLEERARSTGEAGDAAGAWDQLLRATTISGPHPAVDPHRAGSETLDDKLRQAVWRSAADAETAQELDAWIATIDWTDDRRALEQRIRARMRDDANITGNAQAYLEMLAIVEKAGARR